MDWLEARRVKLNCYNKIFDFIDDECNTPVLNPTALNVYDLYIVINRGVELKEKGPPWICHFMFQ